MACCWMRRTSRCRRGTGSRTPWPRRMEPLPLAHGVRRLSVNEVRASGADRRRGPPCRRLPRTTAMSGTLAMRCTRPALHREVIHDAARGHALEEVGCPAADDRTDRGRERNGADVATCEHRGDREQAEREDHREPETEREAECLEERRPVDGHDEIQPAFGGTALKRRDGPRSGEHPDERYAARDGGENTHDTGRDRSYPSRCSTVLGRDLPTSLSVVDGVGSWSPCA